jgi:long-chain acyl-CoA synthetase
VEPYRDRPWLASYPDGVPAEVDVDRYRSLVALFEESCDRYRHRPAYVSLGRHLCFGDLDRLSARLAAFLRNDLGLEPGERVAIMLPNVLQYPVALFGILRAGLVVVNVNPLYTVPELRHQLVDSGASAIVVLDNFAHTLAETLAATPCRHVVTTAFGDLLGWPKSVLINAVLRYLKKRVPPFSLPGAIRFNDALARGARRALPPTPIGPDDVAFLQYTGGTTGVAKGATLLHRNLVANLQQATAWVQAGLRPGEEIVITALPLYHVFALVANCLVFLRFGGLNVLIADPRDLAGLVATLRRYRFTAITGVNTLLDALLRTRGFDRLDFSKLHLTLTGGMALLGTVAERWRETTGCAAIEAYGLTESSPAVCINPLDGNARTGTIGLPLPSTEVTLRGDDGHTVAIGEAGELCVRGPQVMPGYWQRPQDTAAAIDAEGWLASGDIARMEEGGFFRIVDRKKDMILVSGFNVYPNEIEDVVARHPGVREVAAIGVPDAHSGEAVKLFVVRRDPGLTAAALLDYCKANLTGYKRPRSIEFRDALPRTGVGKIMRRALRDAATPAQASAESTSNDSSRSA